MKKTVKLQIKAPTAATEKLLNDIYIKNVSAKDMEAAQNTILYCTQQVVPAGYTVHTSDIIDKTETGYTVRALIERVSEGLGS